MKWIGQHIYDLTSRFRSNVFLEDISSGTIASGAHLGLDSNNKIVKAADGGGDITSVVAGTGLTGSSLTSGDATLNVIGGTGITANANDIALTNGLIADGSNITSVGIIGTGQWQGEPVASAYLDADTAHLTTDQTFTGSKTFSNDQTTFLSANANDPLVLIKNTADDNTSGRLRFLSDRGADGEDDDSVGMIQFYGYDDGTPSGQQYGRILTTIHDATAGEESGTMVLSVANHDGGLESGLTLTGGSVNAEVDVAVGTGAASVTTIAGTLTMGSTATINNSGVIQVAAQTVIDHDQLANFAANEHFTQANITTLGTIGTGVWNGTAIASAYIADDAVTFAKAIGVTPNVYGSTIKVLPSDFMANEEAGVTKTIQFVDNTASGLKPGNANTELLAFVSIPEGMKATLIDVYDEGHNLAVEVFEVRIDQDGITSRGSGNANTQIDITDVNATATNYLMIQVTTTATSQRIHGALVTIAAQ